MGRWKAVQSAPNGEVELYDLEDDVSETTDVADDHAEIVAAAGGIHG